MHESNYFVPPIQNSQLVQTTIKEKCKIHLLNLEIKCNYTNHISPCCKYICICICIVINKLELRQGFVVVVIVMQSTIRKAV